MASALWILLILSWTGPAWGADDPFTPSPVFKSAPAAKPAPAKPVAKPAAPHPPKPAARKKKGFRVVIDPGHGGADLGTIHELQGRRYSEKELTLLLSIAVAEQLRARGIQVTLTRDSDLDLPLGPRTALANKLGANIFISIHMNATQTPMVTDAEGVETYILNNTTEASSRNLARLENTVLTPDTKRDTPEEVDVALILRDLRLDANLPESKRLACIVQTRLVAAAGTASHARNRGVKQALFHVLLGAEMPSILVEAGFLNNDNDRNLILNPKTRKAMAVALANSVVRFKNTAGTPAAAETLSRCKVH